MDRKKNAWAICKRYRGQRYTQHMEMDKQKKT